MKTKEEIIDNLTKEQEDILKDVHAQDYTGTDDDMVEDYEKWLMDLTLMDIESYLE